MQLPNLSICKCGPTIEVMVIEYGCLSSVVPVVSPYNFRLATELHTTGKALHVHV